MIREADAHVWILTEETEHEEPGAVYFEDRSVVAVFTHLRGAMRYVDSTYPNHGEWETPGYGAQGWMQAPPERSLAFDLMTKVRCEVDTADTARDGQWLDLALLPLNPRSPRKPVQTVTLPDPRPDADDPSTAASAGGVAA